MFGERHFTIRDRLASLFEEVRALAVRSGSGKKLQDDARRKFQSPVRLLALGPVNSGKSSFLNALLDSDFCEVSRLPETDQFLRYSYARSRSVTQTVGGVEHHLPDELLRYFEPIDSPGAERLGEQEKQRAFDLAEEADLVFILFPLENPWSAQTWELLEAFPKEFHQRTVLVLSKTGGKAAADLAVVMDHMGRLCEKKIGSRLRIFPVSSELVMEARAGAEVDRRKYLGSGFEELEGFINDRINYHTGRRRELGKVCQLLQQDLRIVEGQIEELTHRLATEKAYLRQLETAHESHRELQLRSIEEDFSSLGKAYQRACQSALEKLHRRLNLTAGLLSLFTEEKLSVETERTLIEVTYNEIGIWADDEAGRLYRSCQEHWKATVPMIEDRLEMKAPSFSSELGKMESARREFISLLQQASTQGVQDLKLRSLLDYQLELRRGGFRRYLIVILSSLTLGGTLGALNSYPAAWVFLGIALLFTTGALLFNWKSRSAIYETYEKCLVECREPFTMAIQKRTHDAITGFYRSYGTLLNAVRDHIAASQADLVPQSEEWNALFLELKSLEQQI